jgi:hypothetical protein
MAVFFHRYPAILREVEHHPSEWLRQLDARTSNDRWKPRTRGGRHS